jgi:predicted RNase H-like nuclease
MSTNPHLTPSFRKPKLDIPLHHIKVPPHTHAMVMEIVARASKLSKQKISSQEFLTAQVYKLMHDMEDGSSFERRVQQLEPYIRSWRGDWKRLYLSDAVYQEFKTAVDRLRETTLISGNTQKGLYPSNVVTALLTARFSN